jgi:hypothetical protein
LQTYFGTEINKVVYQTLWDFLNCYEEVFFKAVIEKIILKFKPTTQNPFPLVANFDEMINELREDHRQIKNRVPEYKMLPEPDGRRYTQEEIDEFMNDLYSRMKWLRKNANS